MLVDLLLPKLIYCLVESAEHIFVGTWISVICLDSFCWMSKTQDHVLRVCTEGKKGLRNGAVGIEIFKPGGWWFAHDGHV